MSFEVLAFQVVPFMTSIMRAQKRLGLVGPNRIVSHDEEAHRGPDRAR